MIFGFKPDFQTLNVYNSILIATLPTLGRRQLTVTYSSQRRQGNQSNTLTMDVQNITDDERNVKPRKVTKVSFNPTTECLIFSRGQGFDTIPSDGGVSLGLNTYLETVAEPLGDERNRRTWSRNAIFPLSEKARNVSFTVYCRKMFVEYFGCM